MSLERQLVSTCRLDFARQFLKIAANLNVKGLEFVADDLYGYSKLRDLVYVPQSILEFGAIIVDDRESFFEVDTFLQTIERLHQGCILRSQLGFDLGSPLVY